MQCPAMRAAFSTQRVAAVALLLAAGLPELAQRPGSADAVREISDRRQLFVDDALIERMAGVALRLHSPQPREVVFRFDAPWEGPESGYVTILSEDDGYRMYYRGGGEQSREHTCLALSDNAIHWTRPSLGLFEFNGSRDNNIVWTGERKAYWESHNFSPFKDTRPGVPAAERYKAVTLARGEVDGETRRVLVAFVSPDGIRWQRLRGEPIVTDGSFDSHNVAFWDAAQEQYVCYFRIGQAGRRSVARSTSPDFRTWSATQPLDFGDSPPEHLYTSGILPYPRAPQVYIGLAQRFVPERTTIGADRRPIDGTSDGVFMSSRDGVHWDRRFMEAFIRPGLDPANWGGAHGNNCPSWGIVLTGPAELSVYWAEHYGNYPEHQGRIPQLRRGTLRPDGFVSVHAPYAGGELVTKPLRFEGSKLVLNVATSAVGSVRVEILDASEQVEILDASPSEPRPEGSGPQAVARRGGRGMAGMQECEDVATAPLCHGFRHCVQGTRWFRAIQKPSPCPLPAREGGACAPAVLRPGRPVAGRAGRPVAGRAGHAVPSCAGRPIPGFELENCPEIYGDELERVVQWKGDPDVAALSGRPIRLRFVLRDADLYAFQFRP